MNVLRSALRSEMNELGSELRGEMSTLRDGRYPYGYVEMSLAVVLATTTLVTFLQKLLS